MSDLDTAINRMGRKKRRLSEVKVEEATPEVATPEVATPEVTQEVTERPVIVVQEVAVAKRPERQPTPRTIAEMERGRRALAEIAAQRAAVKK